MRARSSLAIAIAALLVAAAPGLAKPDKPPKPPPKPPDLELLTRSQEAALRQDRIKFRVGKIVFLALSRDETTMGCGFPKEERAAMVEAEPAKFQLPSASDMRYRWIHVTLAEIDQDELRELVVEAWRMVVPKRVAAAHLSPDP